MSTHQPKPRFIRHGKAQVQRRSHLVEIPWVETSGNPKSPYEHNNWTNAAVFSLLTGLQCDDLSDLKYWVHEAKRQIDGAVKALKKKGAKVVPSEIVKPAKRAKKAK